VNANTPSTPTVMIVTHLAMARGLARSASIWRLARTSAATDSARLSRTAARPGPRRRAPRMRFAATRSPVASSNSSANARSAFSVDHRARNLDTSLDTSGLIGSGVEPRVAINACSKPTPEIRTPDNPRVHSSISSSRAILDALSDADRSTGRPATAVGTTSSASTQPDASATTIPAASPTSSRVRIRREMGIRGKRRRGGRVATSAGIGRSPAAIPIRPATISAPPTAGASGVMACPPADIPQGIRRGRNRSGAAHGTSPADHRPR